jgi:acyl-CoA synthetase (AMP-forming)/AMP-acid ligase II
LSFRLALITSCNAEALFVLFACGTIGVPCIVINGFANVDELWQQVDASEATHCITEETFMTKVEDVRRRGAMRGGSCGRIRVIKLLADVLGDRPISLDLAAGINRKSISSRPDATKQQHRLISRVR